MGRPISYRMKTNTDSRASNSTPGARAARGGSREYIDRMTWGGTGCSVWVAAARKAGASRRKRNARVTQPGIYNNRVPTDDIYCLLFDRRIGILTKTSLRSFTWERRGMTMTSQQISVGIHQASRVYNSPLLLFNQTRRPWDLSVIALACG